MRDIEKQIILAIETPFNSLENFGYSEHFHVINGLMIQYQKNGFGQSTYEFLMNPVLKKHSEFNKSLSLWLTLEKYLCVQMGEKEVYFDAIKSTVTKIKSEIFKSSGQGLYAHISKDLIRDIYLSNDAVLISLFMNNLPIPKIGLFNGYPLPIILHQKQQDTQASLAKFLTNPKVGWKNVVIKMQRNFRSKRKQKEEFFRLCGYQFIPGGFEPFKDKTQAEIEADVREILQDVNTPYVPKSRHCSPELAQKLVQAAGKVKLFTTIRHLTSAKYLHNILDDGLMGRRTLLQNYLPFKPAALDEADLEYGGGDANVICFGPNEIDPEAIQSAYIEIIMNLDQMKTNPCIFYKQRDLNYSSDWKSQINKIIFQDCEFIFSHLKLHKDQPAGYTSLQFFENESASKKNIIAVSHLPNYLFSSYDTSKMHQILTLNFFRFIDTLHAPNSSDDSFAKKIYDSFNQLSEEGEEGEFIACIQNLGIQMTKTTELNVYGMFQIEFEIEFAPVKSIATGSFCLECSEFISALRSGNIDKLNEAKKAIPNLFRSYRFLDYLLSVTESKFYPPVIQHELQRMSLLCIRPAYLTRSYNTRCYQEEMKVQPPCEFDENKWRKAFHNIL